MPAGTHADEIEVGAGPFCSICGCVTRRKFSVRGYWIRSCTGCAHEAAEIRTAEDHVQSVYADDYFQGGGAGYPDYLAEADLLRARGRWYGRLLASHTRPGLMLDVGTAAGFILQGFQEQGWTVHGIEPNAGMAAFGRQVLGLPIDAGTLEDLRSTECYDLVSLIQVVAHLVDVRKAFQVASQITKDGALLLIETWNRRSWTARIFGSSWHEYSPPSVLRWFSPDDLERLVAQFGFRKIAQGRPPRRIRGAHAKALLEYKLQEGPVGRALSPLTRVIPDRVHIPYPAEDLFWALFRRT